MSPRAAAASGLLLAALLLAPPRAQAGPEASASATSPHTADPFWGWEKIDDRDGIVIYRKKIEGAPILLVGAEATLEASAAEVCSILLDFEAYGAWVDRVREVTVLERNSPLDVTLYSLFDLPWPFSDRDFVVRMVAKIDPGKKHFTLFERSLRHVARPEQACCVRGEIQQAAFSFTELGPRRTRILSYAQIDFRGSIPGWVARIIQEKFPRKTIEGYRKRLAMPGVRRLPACAALTPA